MKELSEQDALGSNPQTHDFDWVKEGLECSIEYEFAKLEMAARANTQTMQKSGHDKEGVYTFQNDNGKSFRVGWKNPPFKGEAVEFRLDKNDRKIVVLDTRKEAPIFEARVSINSEGECRYRIPDDQKEYLRWQILHKALSQYYFRT